MNDEILKYVYDMNNNDSKAIGAKHMFKYIETGGFSLDVFIRMLLIIGTIVTDILIVLLKINLEMFYKNMFLKIVFLILCLLNLLILYSGKFLYVNKGIFSKIKKRNKRVSLKDAKFYKARCNFIEKKNEDGKYKLSLYVDEKKMDFCITHEIYNRIKGFYNNDEVAIFFYSINNDIQIFEIMKFVIYEKYVKKNKKIEELKKTRKREK